MNISWICTRKVGTLLQAGFNFCLSGTTYKHLGVIEQYSADVIAICFYLDKQTTI